MVRYLPPTLFVVAAMGVRDFNDAESARQILFPGVWLVPGYQSDVYKQGQLSWQILGIGFVVTLVWAVWDQIRQSRLSAG